MSIKRNRIFIQISMEGQIGKELDLMCNLSGYVEKKGIEKGIEQTKVLMVSNMLKQGYPDGEIMKIAEISEKMLEEIKKQCFSAV